ncbi:hypothetical protein C8A03DRAFT_14718 [Achaetomium macrosporum]|uniref:Uncharacterized protein n=1 Tax=Achaetomium macrosporum TaxID=79813 RepID=A0AAN7HCU3_9PEZI|nr:hypothetical protein C8A03DRAFT_14718 [Achaetomium macrosporum]
MSTSTTQDASSAPGHSDPVESAVHPNVVLASHAHFMELVSLRDPIVGDSHGSVLAVVTFPKASNSARACDGRPWQEVQIRMSYEKLIGLGSKKIEAMFSPRAQARFRRRLGFEQQLPAGIQYVVDFTPPSEGPELADLTAALWLPSLVKIWFLAGQYIPDPIMAAPPIPFLRRPLADRAVGAMLVLGHDDVCKRSSCYIDVSEWQPKHGLHGIVDENPGLGHAHIPSWRRVEDYCPVRHRVAIIRVLKAINGDILLLNSAVRMWTVAQVAISLDVPQVVRDPVTQWLIAPPNTKFIEICPEKAFQLAYVLNVPSVLIAAFRILVNELAIDYASSDPWPRRPALTWIQRRRDDYGDYPSDPVEYASRAFAERMNGQLKMLQESEDVFSRLPYPIPEWEKLQYYGSVITSFGPSPLLESYTNLTAALLFVFRSWVERALHIENFPSEYCDVIAAQRKHYIPDAECTPLEDLYKRLNPAQKVLTPFFWDQLMRHQPHASFVTRIYAGHQLRTYAQNFNMRFMEVISDSQSFQSAVDANHPGVADSHLFHRKIDLTHPALADTVSSLSDVKNLKFNLDRFYNELKNSLQALCLRILYRDRDNDSGIPFFLSDHLLLSLDESELNYLPIWADGLDDGSGGVFQDAIPEAEMGPSEPGPGYHTGYTVGVQTGAATETEADYGTIRDNVSTTAPSDLGMAALELQSAPGEGDADGESATVGRSVAVQRSITTTGGATETSSYGGATPSESFATDDGMYADARYAQPAAHQPQGQAIEQYMDEVEAGDGASSSLGGAGGEGIDLDLDSDEEMDWGSDGSSTLDGFEEVDADEAR